MAACSEDWELVVDRYSIEPIVDRTWSDISEAKRLKEEYGVADTSHYG